MQFLQARAGALPGLILNDEIVSKINSGVSPWQEPKLDTLLNFHMGKIIEQQLPLMKQFNDSDVTFVIVPTPSKVRWVF